VGTVGHWTGAIALGLLAGACANDDTNLEVEEHVRTWANAASAVGVYANVYEPLAIADGERILDDPSCPVITEDEETFTITGDGCIDAAGDEWAGAATIVDNGTTNRTLIAHGYAHIQDPAFRSTTTGSVFIQNLTEITHGFDVNVRVEGALTTRYDYIGQVDGSYGQRTVWRGSGTVSRDGPISPTGTIEARTFEEVLDDSVCSGQAVSGQTVLQDSEGRLATIAYDGATDCDADQAAQWSLDGVDQGRITGIVCAVSSPGIGSGSPGALGALLVVGVAVRLRRRRRTQRLSRPAASPRPPA
jgi:MYXO-CTERM domain-containing protein